LYCSAFAGIAESAIKHSAENPKAIIFMTASFVFEWLGSSPRNPSGRDAGVYTIGVLEL
jgi:hypothetical protein